MSKLNFQQSSRSRARVHAKAVAIRRLDALSADLE